MSSATVRVEKATSDLLIGPDWTMNMDICDSINTNHWQAKDVVKAVKKRLQHKNPKVQLLALTLLETMIKNCGDYVHLQVAERNILQEMIKIVRKKVDMNVRDKILVLLDSWQEAFGGPRGKYPQYYWAYDELKRSGVEFPKRSVDAAPIFTPPVTHPTARHSLAGYGMPSNSTRTLDEAMASEMESLSLSNLDSIRSIMELLNEMLQAVNSNDREALKDEVIMDLASRCRSNQKKLVQLLNSTGDEELLGQGLALNDSLQTLLAKHDAIASGSPLPTEAISSSATSAPGTSSPPSKVNDSSSKVTAPETQEAVTTHQVDEEDEEDDDFAQLARRRSRTSNMPSQSTSTETTTTGTATPCNALALPDPPTAVRTTTKEQDMIDLLSITLCTNSTSPHSPLTPPTTYSTSTPPPSSSNQGGHQVPISPSAQGSPYGPQQYPGQTPSSLSHDCKSRQLSSFFTSSSSICFAEPHLGFFFLVSEKGEIQMSMAMASSSVSSKICFNQDCKEPKPDRWRTAWRLRTGDFAELCDRCASAYEEVRFCETFHSEASGWRNCESCGKRVHCGCIASMHAFTLLDMGGVECMTCARKNFITVPNQIWPSSTLPPLPLPERLKDISAKNWSQSTGSNSNPGQWWQPQSSWNSAVNQSDLHPRMPYEVDRLNSVDSRLISGEHPASALENKTVKDPLERITSGSLKLAVPEGLANGNVNVDSLTSLNAFHKERNIDGLQDTGHLTGDNDPRDARKGVTADPLRRSVARMGFETLPSSCLNISLQSTLKDDSSLFNSAVSFSSPNEKSDQTRVSGTMSQRQMPPPPLAKQLFPNPQNVVDTPGELQAQMRCGRPRGDGQKRGQVLPRYWPRISDQELQQMSGDSNSVITPLFEKMLSASDAGRIGRLVLPKKCAEAYFPAISQPEGLPLKVQDAKGKDWLFQFRFWPNNNSRMYVLEGVTPCIQSMQLQAGDIVTFSRIDPEGKLLMGFRKASSVPSEQDVQAFKTGNGFSTSGEVSNKITKLGEPGSTPTLRPHKGDTESTNLSSINQVNPNDSAHTWSKFEKSGGISKDGPGAKSSLCKKKSSLGSKNKRLRITHEDSLDLKLTWEEAQDILRPPPNNAPNIVVIEGYEFEEYKEAPVLGKPTLFTVNHAGEKHQWTQCEDCSKWRKLPLDALLPSRWTCSDNSWDLKRSSCSSAQELTTEQLEQLGCSNRASSKRTRAKEEIDTVEASEGLDTLANLAILGEGDALNSSTQPTTKHPRHRPGCSCIVCIQPPSGKGPKHKQTCTCNVCLTVKRRFRTLMLRREKRQSEKEAESARKKQELQPSVKPEIETEELASNHSNDDGPNLNTMASDGVCDDPSRRKSSSSPFKGHIDLNIQPEREEEPSPVSDSGSMMRLLRDAREFYPKEQTLENLVINRDLTINHMETIGGVGGQRLDTEPPGTTQPDVDVDHLVPVSMSLLASTSGTG